MPPLDLEQVKREGLTVDLERLAREGWRTLTPADRYRLKMHGICAQRHEGFFMLRHRIPGGRLDPERMEILADAAERYASGFVHLTTRQNVELHSVRLEKIPALFEIYRKAGITTRSSCGHTFRNVLGSPCAGTCPTEILDVRPWVDLFSDLIVHHSDHYNHRLPKRLNVSFAGCTSCADPALFNDIGFAAVRGPGHEIGFSLCVAGSLGVTPRVGWRILDFLSLEDAIPAAAAVAHLYIVHADRKNPAKGRLKFLLESWGPDRFREELLRTMPRMRQAVEGFSGSPVPPALPPFHPPGGTVLDPPPDGVLPQRQKGFYRVCVVVPLGEIHHTHFRAFARWSRENAHGRVVLTPEQNLEFQWVPGERVAALRELAGSLGYAVGGSGALLDVQACPGTSFCSLALTGSQGAAAALLDHFRRIRAAEDPSLASLRVHVSGCPNACARHQVADIGFSGGMTRVGEDQRFAYQLFLGGNPCGDDLEVGTIAKRAIADEMVVPVVDALFTVFLRDREPGETFRTFIKRLTVPEVVRRLDALLVERGLSPHTYNRVTAEPWERLTAVPGG